MEAEYKVKIYGDSIMRGVIFDAVTGTYSTREGVNFERLAAEGLDVSCVARKGATSAKGLELVRRDTAAEPHAHYDAVLLEFGANDADYDWDAIAASPCTAHQPKVSEADFLDNMHEMLSLVRPRADIIIISNLAPFDTDKYFAWLTRRLEAGSILKWLGTKENLQNSYRRYNELAGAFALKEGLPLFNLRAVLSETGDISCGDGVHPSQEGYDRMDAALLARLKSLL